MHFMFFPSAVRRTIAQPPRLILANADTDRAGRNLGEQSTRPWCCLVQTGTEESPLGSPSRGHVFKFLVIAAVQTFILNHVLHPDSCAHDQLYSLLSVPPRPDQGTRPSKASKSYTKKNPFLTWPLWEGQGHTQQVVKSHFLPGIQKWTNKILSLWQQEVEVVEGVGCLLPLSFIFNWQIRVVCVNGGRWMFWYMCTMWSN